MAITGTADLITAVQQELHQASAADLADADMRALILGWAQTVVSDYWYLHPWRERVGSAAIEFDSDGAADLPTDFATWRYNQPAVVWSTLERSLHTSNALHIAALRTSRPNDRGDPVYVGVEGRSIIRFPRPSVAPESATALYYRVAPALTDANEGGGLDQIDPAHYRPVLFEGMRWQTYRSEGDAREQQAFATYRQAAARQWAEQALDTQPARWGRGYISHVRRLRA